MTLGSWMLRVRLALTKAPQALVLAAICSKLQALVEYILGITTHPETVADRNRPQNRMNLSYPHIILDYTEGKMWQKQKSKCYGPNLPLGKVELPLNSNPGEVMATEELAGDSHPLPSGSSNTWCPGSLCTLAALSSLALKS